MSEVTQHAPGQIVVATRNAVSEAIATIAEIAGRQVVVLGDDDPEGTPRERLTADPPTPRDAVVICDHDAPEAYDLLRDAIASPAGYVAMMASRQRTASVLTMLRDEGADAATLEPGAPAGRAQPRWQDAGRDRPRRSSPRSRRGATAGTGRPMRDGESDRSGCIRIVGMGIGADDVEDPGRVRGGAGRLRAALDPAPDGLHRAASEPSDEAGDGLPVLRGSRQGRRRGPHRAPRRALLRRDEPLPLQPRARARLPLPPRLPLRRPHRRGDRRVHRADQAGHRARSRRRQRPAWASTSG